MLRREITEGVNKVLQAIDDSRILPLLHSFVPGQKKPERGAILECFAKYMLATQGFGRVENAVVQSLSLQPLQNPKLWETMVVSEPRSKEFAQIVHSVRSAKTYLPRFLRLLDGDVDAIHLMTDKKGDTGEVSVLTAIVMENREASSPQRLILVLEAITGLYDACANIAGEKADGLSVVACDSGSDKSFDFLGAAKIVESVKQVILSFWDKVIYYREDKTGKYIELIANSLPVLEEIDDLKASGNLEPERAELIKRQVVDSITKFARAGVTIPEIEGFTHYNPRQLMQPDRKLLVASLITEEIREETNGGPHEVENASLSNQAEGGDFTAQSRPLSFK